MKIFQKAKIALALTVALGAATVATQVQAVNLSTDGIGDVAIAPYYSVNDGWMTLINLTNTSNKPIVVKVRVHEGKNSRDVYDYDVALSGRDVYSAVLKRDANGRPMIKSTDEDTCTIPQTIDGQLNALGYSGTDDRNMSNNDAMSTNTTRLGEGYIEFIVMGYTNVFPADVGGVFPPGSKTVGASIENHDCADVESAFTKQRMTNNSSPATGDYGPSTQSQFGEPINALKFNFRLLNPSRGIEVGNAATTWANFFSNNVTVADPLNLAGNAKGTPVGNTGCIIGRGDERDGSTDWDPSGGVGAAAGDHCVNLMTAQEPYDFLEPSLNDAYPVGTGMIVDGTNKLDFVSVLDDLDRRATGQPANTQGRGVDVMSATIMRSAVVNEWSLNATLGTKTDWVITMPTKSFYVDFGAGRQFARIAGDRDEAIYLLDGVAASIDGSSPAGKLANTEVYPPFAAAFGANGSCNQVTFASFDRAENQEVGSSGVIPSPAPAQATTSLCWEANVLTFGGASSLLASDNVKNVSMPKLLGDGATKGWLRLDLTTSASAQAPDAVAALAIATADTDNDNSNGVSDGVVQKGLFGYSGLPVIGMMVKQRTFGDVTKNYGSSLAHGYERELNYNHSRIGDCALLTDNANAGCLGNNLGLNGLFAQ